MNFYDEILRSSLSIAKYYGIPLGDVEQMSLEDFQIAIRLADEQIKEQTKQTNEPTAPAGARFRKIT